MRSRAPGNATLRESGGAADTSRLAFRAVTLPHLTWPRPAGDLTLELPSPELLGEVLRWRNDRAVTRWLIRTTVDPTAFRTAWLASVDDPRDHAAVAVLDGRAVATGSLEVHDGMAQTEPGSPADGCEGLLGYLVDPAYAGRGIATAVAAALLDLAFRDLGLLRVTAGCFADNVASWTVMEKLGMRREQHGVRDSWHAELGWIDGFTYGILAEEWLGRAKPLASDGSQARPSTS
jgi:RimJ/RimL family protein N-acetyltransferase